MLSTTNYRLSCNIGSLKVTRHQEAMLFVLTTWNMKFLILFFKYLYLPHRSQDAIQFCSIFTLSDIQFPVAACVAHVAESVMSAHIATKLQLAFA
jgi:hypothetical protein